MGTGNWAAFNMPLERIFDAAATWKHALSGVEKPWLCWNVSHPWCVLQQKLVRSVGWTPVVGFDPRVGPPPLIPEAILIDFNERFQLPVMWLHFPLDFAFLFAERLAFWHADLLCRKPVMEKVNQIFSALEDGTMAAVLDRGGRRNWLRWRAHRYFELCGCTTRSASENQFYNGTGWWRHMENHVKCVVRREIETRKRYSYDNGVAIMYWKRRYNGNVVSIPVDLVKEGHCSEIGKKNYKVLPGHLSPLRALSDELNRNYSLAEVAARLGIADLL